MNSLSVFSADSICPLVISISRWYALYASSVTVPSWSPFLRFSCSETRASSLALLFSTAFDSASCFCFQSSSEFGACLSAASILFSSAVVFLLSALTSFSFLDRSEVSAPISTVIPPIFVFAILSHFLHCCLISSAIAALSGLVCTLLYARSRNSLPPSEVLAR